MLVDDLLNMSGQQDGAAARKATAAEDRSRRKAEKKRVREAKKKQRLQELEERQQPAYQLVVGSHRWLKPQHPNLARLFHIYRSPTAFYVTFEYHEHCLQNVLQFNPNTLGKLKLSEQSDDSTGAGASASGAGTGAGAVSSSGGLAFGAASNALSFSSLS